jgi:hypothetical protein
MTREPLPATTTASPNLREKATEKKKPAHTSPEAHNLLPLPSTTQQSQSTAQITHHTSEETSQAQTLIITTMWS